jgi:membrane protein DedA with SNARE-associated domain/diacylglycerol kinase family enzyme
MSAAPARAPAGRSRALTGAAAATATALAAAVAFGLLEVPDPTATLSDASRTLGGWTYLAVPAFALLETGAFVGLLVPGETAVVVGGVVAERGDVALPALIGLVWAAAVTGDVVSFTLGRRLGRPFLAAHGDRLRIRPEHLGRAERFFDRYGGRAVLLGRFVGVLRALTPFLAGASRMRLRGFLPYSALGALAWAAAFTLVGYGFAGSFESAGETAARIALAAALVAAAALVLAARLRGTWLRRGDEPLRQERRDRAEGRAEKPTRDHVERIVHAQIDARNRHPHGEPERPEAQARAENRDRRGGRERGRAVTRGKGGVAGQRDERAEVGLGLRRTRPVEDLLQPVRHEGRARESHRRGRAGDRQAPAPEIRGEAQAHQDWTLHPPRREHDEDRGQRGMLEERRDLDERAVELERRHRRATADGSNRAELLVVVNARASGVDDPERTSQELVALLAELGATAGAAVTRTEPGLWEALRAAAASGRRVVLVGGDGSLHAAANAPLATLPELALVPAGRANNIARALAIPSDRLRALEIAALADARPLDALRVRTPGRSLFAVEAVSAGFQAEARQAYAADNSADLHSGLRAFAGRLLRYAPYRVAARLDGVELGSERAAQLFLSNLPFFGFGFEVNPGADPADGRLDAVMLDARGRLSLLRLLGAVYRGRHLGRPGVARVSGRRAELTHPLPLVADTVPLGTTTATVSVDPARLRVVAPERPGDAA